MEKFQENEKNKERRFEPWDKKFWNQGKRWVWKNMASGYEMGQWPTDNTGIETTKNSS